MRASACKLPLSACGDVLKASLPPFIVKVERGKRVVVASRGLLQQEKSNVSVRAKVVVEARDHIISPAKVVGVQETDRVEGRELPVHVGSKVEVLNPIWIEELADAVVFHRHV